MSAGQQGQGAFKAGFPADVSRLSDVRRITAAQARLWGTDEDAVHEAMLIVDELFANAVRHGSRPGDDVMLSLTPDGPELRIAVTDTRPGTPQREAPGEDETRGRGLFLVDALAAKWGVDPTGAGKCTWTVLTLPSRIVGQRTTPALLPVWEETP